MEQARIGIIEDNVIIASLATEVLEDHGHSVELTAHSREEAILKIGKLSTEGVCLDVILLDGKLNPESDLGEDAQVLAPLIHSIAEKNNGWPVVMGFSSNDMPAGTCEVNSYKNIDVVLMAVKNLPDRA